MERIGLVLSGGAANGFAHVGALHALEGAGIKIDAIAGCSMGSIIGALYSSGRTASEIEKIILNKRGQQPMNFSLSARGAKSMNGLNKDLIEFMGTTTFEELKIPLYINATNLSTGKQVVFSEGDVFSAVRSSIAIPGLIPPTVSQDKDLYVDGGVINNAPFTIFPKEIKKYIIVNAVEYRPLQKGKKHKPREIATNSTILMMDELLNMRLSAIPENDYVLVTPRIPDFTIFPSEETTIQIMASGKKAMKEKIPEILRKLKA